MASHTWSVNEISDAVGPSANLRNYLEQRDVRKCLAEARARRPIARAVDVGCGYGRLTMVLSEVAAEVIGFEREEALVRTAASLLPHISFRSVSSLGQLPCSSGFADFGMTFTVLQHMRNADALSAIAELKRVVGNGSVLLVEETDPAASDNDPVAGEGGLTVGRAVETYQEWMQPFRLVKQFAREIEPGYPRKDVGTYMLFQF